MNTYLVHMIREFDASEELMKAHWDYLYGLKNEGKMGLAGPYANVQGGAYVFREESLEKAEDRARTDPLVVNGIAQYVIFEWNAQEL